MAATTSKAALVKMCWVDGGGIVAEGETEAGWSDSLGRSDLIVLSYKANHFFLRKFRKSEERTGLQINVILYY